MAGHHQYNALIPFDEFRMKASAMSDNSARNYKKAITSFESFVNRTCRCQPVLSENILTDWFIDMSLQGLSMKTMSHYLDIIAALYKDTQASSCDAVVRGLSIFKQKIKTFGVGETTPLVTYETLKKVQSITRHAAIGMKDKSMAADILLLSLLLRCMPIAEVGRLKTSDIDTENALYADIVGRNTSPRRKYLFNLNQSRLTDRQLEAKVNFLVGSFLKGHDIPILNTVDDTIRSIWVSAALRSGVSSAEVVAMLDVLPSCLPFLSLCERADISSLRKSGIDNTIAIFFTDNPFRWYAMKLRPRVTYEDILKKISSIDDSQKPELFYPYQEIARKIGKKLVFDKKPVIRDIVFFRSRLTDIYPLFCHIGDLAWCFTTSGKPGDDYAAIPPASFKIFKDTISHFTSDYEIAPIGGFAPVEGESVVILNGLLANQEFDIEKVAAIENTVFQLYMVGGNGIQWRTTVKYYQTHNA